MMSYLRIKMGAERSTDHHLVVCKLCLVKQPGFARTCRTRRSYWIKWEALVEKDVRKTFADSLLSLFRDLPECKAKVDEEWKLSKAVIASYAARVCR